MPKTINEALKILAYNDYFWSDPQKAHIKPHPKDYETVRSLAESQYVWTEKQDEISIQQKSNPTYTLFERQTRPAWNVCNV